MDFWYKTFGLKIDILTKKSTPFLFLGDTNHVIDFRILHLTLLINTKKRSLRLSQSTIGFSNF